MKSPLWLLCIASALAVGDAQARDPAQDKADLLHAEAALCLGSEQSDVQSKHEYMDETFIATSSRNEITGFADSIREAESRDPVYTEFRNHDQDVRLYGDAAVIVGITTVRGRSGNTAFSGDYRYTDTWIRRDGHWKLAASHSTKLK
ncbi:nuclear transport factor 2 family protein [Luteimonas gilva]|uniref:Nuclear transport factor 2 family protein n=1 Tax=Luteimonas gilva TaxID=2572684 RepID=A0A4U5JMZ5_9GAMM|nr:nuclear transport factor 2 family protein [Luteimonas gilva]TKR31052.1 nuclear transport factor 2 family protein [Luteimonas gilva]